MRFASCYAARFAPLGITLRPWLDHLERRSYKFPGILLAYVAASVPAAVVTQGAAVAAAAASIILTLARHCTGSQRPRRCFDSPGQVRNKWWTAMQELCARHAATFAPLRITLEPWVNLLRGRVMKFPGVLLAYTPANAPAVVVSAGAVPAAGPAVGTVVSPAAGPPVPTTVAPSPYNSSYPPTAGGIVQGYATAPPQAAQAVGTTVAPPPYAPPPKAVQAEVVAVAPMDRK